MINITFSTKLMQSSQVKNDFFFNWFIPTWQTKLVFQSNTSKVGISNITPLSSGNSWSDSIANSVLISFWFSSVWMTSIISELEKVMSVVFFRLRYRCFNQTQHSYFPYLYLPFVISYFIGGNKSESFRLSHWFCRFFFSTYQPREEENV